MSANRRLLVAALSSEIDALDGDLPGYDVLVTGPGKLNATFALTRALDAQRYDEIIVLGTAGAIGEAEPFELFEVRIALQHDVTDLEGVVGQHVSLPPTVETGSGTATIATGDSFVDDAGAVAAIATLGATLVDMEAYAYIWVAQHFGVPIRVFKVVSDRAQDGATLEWDETVAACSAKLRDHFEAFLAS